VGTHEGKNPLGRPTYRWEDNIKIDLEEIIQEFVNWTGLISLRTGTGCGLL
jgi:hypothetical protein